MRAIVDVTNLWKYYYGNIFGLMPAVIWKGLSNGATSVKFLKSGY